MDIATAISGVLTERNALQQPEGVSTPSYISEHMQRLAQYVSSLEERLSDVESTLEEREGELFKKYTGEGKSINAAKTLIKYEIAADQAEVLRLSRLAASSWKLISTSQSRMKHLVAEAQNQF